MATQLDEHVKDLAFTGERFMPEVAGQIAFEHLHRYHFAARFCAGKRVVDVACGEGYGSQILSGVAESVTGIDISAEAVAHAAGRYGSDRLRFVEASAALLPLEDDSVDVVVSFETIEHHDQHEEMLSEIRRILRPGGMLIMSSPNKQHYSIEPGYANPYHLKELFRYELIELIQCYFPQLHVYSQRVVYGSLLVAEGPAAFDSILGTGPETSEWAEGLSRPLYDLVVATDGLLPVQSSSFFELKVHGMDAGAFYGVHLPERVQNADLEVLQLRAKVEELEAQAQLTHPGAAFLQVGEELRQTREAHLAEIERLRDSPNEVLSSISLLGSLVDDVRREGGHDRLAQERRLESLQNALDQNRALVAEAASSQSIDNEQFKAQLAELRQQLTQAVATEERIRSLERMLSESQGMVLGHINANGSLREEISGLRVEIERIMAERDEARQSEQRLQLAVTEQRVIIGYREREVELLKASWSWRCTAWLRKLSGSARRHL